MRCFLSLALARDRKHLTSERGGLRFEGSFRAAARPMCLEYFRGSPLRIPELHSLEVKTRRAMASKAVARCRPTLRHLFILLFLSVSFISFILYTLNNHYESRRSDHSMSRGLAPSEDAVDVRSGFKADFRTLPRILSHGRRRLIILIDSHWRRHDRRSAIRNTWASAAHRFNVSVYFVVGDSDSNEISSIADEGAFYHDLIQPTVWESRSNTLLKILAAYRFVEAEMNDADFVMKTCDNVFVNLPELIDFLMTYIPYSESTKSESQFVDRPQRLIIGSKSTIVGRESTNLLPDDGSQTIPEYAIGSTGYVMSFDVLRRFNICPRVVDLFPDEDVYFTGICRRHFDLDLIDEPRFAEYPPRFSKNLPCLWKTRFVTSGVDGGQTEMETIWYAANKKSTPKC